MELKCSKCKGLKSVNEFHRSNTRKRGYGSHCKECQSKATEGVALATELRCSKCGETKSAEQFNKRPTRPRGYLSRCKACSSTDRDNLTQAEYTRSYRAREKAKDLEAFRRRETHRNLISKYRLTLAEYEAMVESQGGLCALCEKVPNGGKNKKLHIDHDHATGRIRGLLCHGCNTGLGNLREDVELLRKAIIYLETA